MFAATNALSMFVVFTLLPISMVSQQNDWSWFMGDRSLASSQMTAIDDQTNTVLTIGLDDVYRGPLYGRAQGLSASDFSYLNSRPKLLTVPNGTIMAIGSTNDFSTFGILRFDDINSVHQRMGVSELDGESLVSGISTSDYSVIDNSTIRLRNTFSFDGGKRWYRMRNAEQINSQQCFAHRVGADVVVKSVSNNGVWFRVDTNEREYKEATDLDARLCRFALLTDGSGLAIQCEEGDEINLMFRTTTDMSWRPVPILSSPTGAVIDPKRIVFQRSDWLFRTATNKAVLFLDSGLVLEFNGAAFAVRSLSPTIRGGKLVSNGQPRVRGENIIRLLYQAGTGEASQYSTVSYSLENEQVKIYDGLRYSPQDLNNEGYVSAGPYFTDWESLRTRPAITLGSINGKPIQQPYLLQVAVCGATPIVLTEQNDVVSVDSSSNHVVRLPYAGARVGQTSLTSAILRRSMVSSIDDTTFIIPAIAPRVASVSGQSVRLPVISGAPFTAIVTCAHAESASNVLVAGSLLARYNGTNWQNIPFPPQIKDPEVLISSALFRSSDTIMIAARGHFTGSSSTNSFANKPGGVLFSSDQGKSWRECRLPMNEQWVESLIQGPTGDIFCWATDMYLDQAFGAGGSTMPRYGSSRLYSTSDWGQSWKEIYVDRADDSLRRPATEHQWSIDFASNGSIAISTPQRVLVSSGNGSNFNEVSDLPFDVEIGGCGFGSDGALWVVGSHGIHRRNATTSVLGGRTDLRPVESQRIVLSKSSFHNWVASLSMNGLIQVYDVLGRPLDSTNVHPDVVFVVTSKRTWTVLVTED